MGRLREILAGKITGRVHDQAQPDRLTLGLPGYSDRLSRSNERLRIGNLSIGVRDTLERLPLAPLPQAP